MKSFLSFLRQLDSSGSVLRDRTASRRQSQSFTALKFMRSEQRPDKQSLSALAQQQVSSRWLTRSRRIARVSITIALFGKVVLAVFAVSTFPALAAPVSVNICFKTGSELDLNAANNANTKAKLTNAAYFGAGGTAAPETFVFKTLASVTAATLSSNNCQIYFGGGNPDVTSAEATAINNWVQTTGHFVLAGCDYTNNVICTSFGRSLTSLPNGGVSVNSGLSYNPLICGGALTVATFGGASTYIGLLTGDTVLAKHSTANQEPAAVTDSLVTPKFLFTGDADMYGSGGASAIGLGATATTDQAKFVVNSFKFALDAIMGRLGNPQCFASYDQKADLALSISTSNASPSVGGQTTVTVTVINQGPNDATGVAATINLPTGLSLASQTGTGTYSAATQSWSIGALNNGASATIILTLNATSSGSLTIPAQITQSSLPDIDSSTNVGFGTDDLNDGVADDDEATVAFVVVGASMIDYSDAPVTGTAPSGTGTNNYGIATHTIVAGMKLGAAIDAEAASISNATASGDGADDDGISSFPLLTAGDTSYSIPAANITATGTGTLHAWIDFNKNGIFDAGEHTSIEVTNNTLAGALNWTGIVAGATGNTFARFRFTSDATITASTPSGIAANGEVEDYQVSIGDVIITPFKDRINSCGVIEFNSNSEGFRAATITFSGSTYNSFTITPKSAPYPTSSPQFNWQSSGNPGGSIFTNDLDSQWTIFTTPSFGTDTNFSFLNSKSFTFDYKNDTGISGAYDFWVALVGKNGQKVFYSFKNQLSGASTTAFSKVIVPMNASQWFTTFQSPTSTAPTSAAFAGILADLDRIDIGAEGRDGPDLTELDNIGMACDHGDAPDTYQTTASSNGPVHQISPALKLGNKLDAENDGQPTPNADGDDQDLSASNRIGIVDDEDGISSFPRLTAGAISYSIPAANVSATGTGTLSAWIDFNKDGVFSAAEYTSVSITNGTLSGSLNWSGISIGSIGKTFARFRFTSSSLIDNPATTNIDERAVGVATDGEVEDYAVTISTKAKLLLVKRITAIKRNGETVPENFTTFVDDSSSTTPTSDDNHCNWPGATGSAGACTNTYTLGKTSLPDVQTGDEIEYTIYYLNGGGTPAKQAKVCDQLDANLTFQTQFDSSNATTVGKGLALAAGNTALQYLSNTGLDSDSGQLTTPGLATSCNLGARVGGNLSNDVVVVDVGTTVTPLMSSTSAGTPTTSYGYVRFKAKVK